MIRRWGDAFEAICAAFDEVHIMCGETHGDDAVPQAIKQDAVGLEQVACHMNELRNGSGRGWAPDREDIAQGITSSNCSTCQTVTMQPRIVIPASCCRQTPKAAQSLQASSVR